MTAPSPVSPRPPRRSPHWRPRQQPTGAPAPAAPADVAPSAPAPTAPTSHAHHRTTTTPQLVHSLHQHTEQPVNYLRDTPLGAAEGFIGPEILGSRTGVALEAGSFVIRRGHGVEEPPKWIEFAGRRRVQSLLDQMIARNVDRVGAVHRFGV